MLAARLILLVIKCHYLHSLNTCVACLQGNVVPTCGGGGVQVILNDIEVLQQKSPILSPVTSPKRAKIGSNNRNIAEPTDCSLYPDVAARCAVSLEGHPIRK